MHVPKLTVSRKGSRHKSLHGLRAYESLRHLSDVDRPVLVHSDDGKRNKVRGKKNWFDKQGWDQKSIQLH